MPNHSPLKSKHFLQFPLFATLLFTLFAMMLAVSNPCSAIAQTTGIPKSPIDKSQPLKKLKKDFSIPDGAAWDGSWSLYVPDVKAQTLYRYIPSKSQWQTVLKDAGRISATFFQHGRLYLSDNGNQSISFLQRGKKKEVFDFKTIDKKLRPNDLVVDNEGGIYVTFTPQNQVHYIGPQGDHHVAIDGIKTPNGITLSPDGNSLYVSAFAPKEVWKYQVKKPGTVEGGKLFAVLPQSDGLGADGMAIDRAGNVYCTGPAGVAIWSPDGQLLDEIVTPSKPINCIFGDPDMRTLYISCLSDGVYQQRVNISGKSPQPPIDADTTTQGQPNKPSTLIPESIEPSLDVVYSTVGTRKMLMDVFVPTDAKNSAAVLVVHGGGWLKGDKTKFRGLAIELAKNGFVSAAVEYRLGHEAKFPAAIQDCFSAVRFLRANSSRFKLDPQRIGAVGGSAGGHLVGLMAAAAENQKLVGRPDSAKQPCHISAAIVLAGPMQMVTGSVAERSRRGGKSNSNIWIGQTVDEAEERYRLADAFEQFSSTTPPILFMTGELDNPERNAPSRKKLKSLGVWTDLKIYKNGKHGCWNQKPWFQDMSEDIVSFFKEHLKEKK